MDKKNSYQKSFLIKKILLIFQRKKKYKYHQSNHRNTKFYLSLYNKKIILIFKMN